MQISELHFLVAEDHSFQRRSLVRILNNLGARHIVEAVDGRAALEVFQSRILPIDICIIDLNMPGMDGIELIRHLAEANSRVSIILASALDRPLIASVETMVKAYGITLLGAIEKPATIEKLQNLINLYQAPLAMSESLEPKIPSFAVDDIVRGLQAKQFEPFFQPKVEIASGRVTGVEALARWHHPQYGLVEPAAFIHNLERHGAIDHLTWVIIENSVAACSAWNDRGLPISVSINLSLTSLEEPSFADQVIEYIAQQRIDAGFIIFEVTESVAMADVPHCLENLARLRMKGFGLSIDDYGTGYSSMQQLLRIPFTELKIDRSFVSGASHNEALISILSSSLELSRKLNLQMVAEGVETQQDWDLLSQLGCTYAQGYFIAKPMAGTEFPDWMRHWTLFRQTARNHL
jgi:EAL domain-containing protein (putative c-di-GMP-specific phosphodiesterase class I)/AmiR/NasT family two-component response regulator